MTPPSGTTTSLESDLIGAVGGEVLFGAGARALYSTDASNYRQVPIGVVRPANVDDVVAAVEVCSAHGAPLLPRGGGTAMAGQSTNAAVVVDFSRHMGRVLSVDPEARLARVEPGCVLDTLQAAAGRFGLRFGPDPATHDHCTLGGMIANNSCGTHSVRTGRTSDNVERLEILTYDGVRMWVGATDDASRAALVSGGGRRGEIYGGLAALAERCGPEVRRRYPDIPRRVAGYNLDDLLPEAGFHVGRALSGTEGTCVTILAAEVRLVEAPAATAVVVLGYDDVGTAGDAVAGILEASPLAVEGFDHRLVADACAEHLRLEGLSILPEGDAWLVVEVGAGDSAGARDAARALAGSARRDGARSDRVLSDAGEASQVWAVREAALGVTARLPDGTPTWTGWEDSAVAPARVGDYLRQLLALYDRYGYRAAVYGHFGGGCIHNRLDFDLTSAEGIARYRAFLDEAVDLVVGLGGSISGEHGDGQSRAELLPAMFGDTLVGAFGEFKELWDPFGKMNPGKVVRPARIDEHLRLGAGWRPAVVRTHFSYPDDGGSFAAATLRCVGVGKCRREAGGTMCPSYMATGEEKDSTRGRARLLFEMLRGDVIGDGWRSEAVLDALDLCLACKGCKSDCPVNVDMATYKAEFLSHHYRGRLRPAAHYSMGWLPALSLAASRLPRVVNALTQSPLSAGLLKKAGGIAPEREIPAYAPTTFRRWFASTPRRRAGRECVLWPDTFTNYFHPHVGAAAVRVLEAAGWSVRLPDRPLCCGLTWISTGQLATAKRVLGRTLDALAPALDKGTPIVGLEPSCTAVLRSDAKELLAGDEAAKRLAEQSVTLAEVLGDWQPPKGSGQALVQAHCHQNAVLGMEDEKGLLARTGLDVELLEPSCCGLAGNFGFEAGHYDISIAAGERVLLPAVRAAARGTWVIADGFSCRTQVVQATGRRAHHLAELLDALVAPAD